MNAGITEIMLVTGGTHAGEFLRLLGNGHEFGIDRLSYGYQERPGGIAEALGLAARFVDGDPVLVMLADNICENSIRPMVDAFRADPQGARILLTPVEEDEHLRHLGVPTFDERDTVIGIVEKPEHPASKFGVTGIYCYDADVFDVIPDPGAVRPWRTRDHRRQQPLHRPGGDGLRRPRGVLGRRRRVDRRLLHGQRLRPEARGQQGLITAQPATPSHSAVSARWRA